MAAGARPDPLIRWVVAGTSGPEEAVLAAARTSRDPAVLVAAALLTSDWPPLLDRAAEAASSTRDRQLVAVATVHLHGESDRALLLARDHLADHPESVLVAHIAALATQR
jgi:hypothetical protein